MIASRHLKRLDSRSLKESTRRTLRMRCQNRSAPPLSSPHVKSRRFGGTAGVHLNNVESLTQTAIDKDVCKYCCRVSGCQPLSQIYSRSYKSYRRGFAAVEYRDRHEATHNPSIPCIHCGNLFSRRDNLPVQCHKLHKEQPSHVSDLPTRVTYRAM